MIADPVFAQADSNKDAKLSGDEFKALADTWFTALDTAKAGKLSEAEFTERLDSVLPSAAPDGGGGGPGRGRGAGGQRGGNEGMGFGPGRFIAGGLFTVSDADKDASITRGELTGGFSKLYTGWDTNKTGALTSEQFRDGWLATISRGGGRGRGPGGFAGRGAGGPGGFGGFGGMFGRQALAQQVIAQGDTDKDQKLSKTELVALAGTWFIKLDPEKSGKVSPDNFTSRLGSALGLPEPEAGQPGSPAQPGGRDGERTDRPGRPARPTTGAAESADPANDRRGPDRGPGGGRGGFGGPAGLAPGLFTAADGNKDNSLTLEELKAMLTKWSVDFDTAKTGSLDEDQLYAGLREVLPQGGFGGFGGFGGGDGTAPKPLTAEQVGLVRAWIDQGAK